MYPLTQITFPGGGTWSVEKGEGVSLEYQPHIKLMQYTGLKDKNGKEIYEGDVVTEWKGKTEHITDVIEWTGDMLTPSYSSQGMKTLMDIGNEFEVIGNIYENPEL